MSGGSSPCDTCVVPHSEGTDVAGYWFACDKGHYPKPSECPDHHAESSTEALRRMLDERGVEWSPGKYYKETNTCWRVGDFEWRASEEKDGRLLVGCSSLATLIPEQAIAATLGTDSKSYDAGFENGVKAVLQQLSGMIAEGADVDEVDAWVDRQWDEEVA